MKWNIEMKWNEYMSTLTQLKWHENEMISGFDFKNHLLYFIEKVNHPWRCAKSLAWPCAEVLRGGPNFEVLKKREDSSDFDDF